MKLKINVNQQLDKCGDEFLDERNFEIEMDLDFNDKYAVCTIDKETDCYIEKSELKRILRLL